MNNWKLRFLHYELRVIQLWPCISMFLYWKVNTQVLFTDNQTFVHFNSQLFQKPCTLFFASYREILGFNIVIAFHCTLLLQRALNGTNICVGIITNRSWCAWLARNGFTFPEKEKYNIVRFSIALTERPIGIQMLTVAYRCELWIVVSKRVKVILDLILCSGAW